MTKSHSAAQHETELTFHVPIASSRPEIKADFSQISWPDIDKLYMPKIDAEPKSIVDFSYDLIGVLNQSGQASGEWDPKLDTATLLDGLKQMVAVRAYDKRMFTMQRQGKLSFYMKSTGEEAIAVAQAMALDSGDMFFPTYRQQGLLFVRNRPVVDMMCHCISNSGDNLKGRQMPVFYSWKEGNFFTISGNLATQYSQAVGWAMASAYKSEKNIASAWVGDGSTAEGDFHYALLFASTYNAPVVLNIVNNQWAISTPQAFAAAGTTFAARGLGYNIPSLRVDGNDFLAVYSATLWAAKRARAGHGPTVIEHVTYRTEGHSTSDNPNGYRHEEEAVSWPLGDPIERLKDHLITLGAWSEEQHSVLEKDADEKMKQDWKNAVAKGTLEDGPHWPAESMFEEVYKEMPTHLQAQREEMKEHQHD